MKEIFSVFKNSLAAKVATLSLSMLMLCMGVAFAQTQTRIKGTVTDEKGTPLVGATVLVVGTQTGTTTDGSGAYFISVKKGAVLDFSYIGFKSERISFATQAVINVVLKEDAARLEDVIVVGFGTQKKASLTAAVSQIKGEELQKSPSTNVSSMLGGRLPGLSSLQSSGQPGADQAQLKIRGSRAGVTYVVDGMVRSISDIDPNDIESISVLKDGGAAAVYGLTAAGGVIIVTTKKGNRGDAKITYKGSYGVSQNAYFPEFLDGPGYAYWYNKAYEQDQIYKTGTPPPGRPVSL